MSSFDGRTVLVTGASSGIGRAAARALAGAGARVVAAALPGPELERLEAELAPAGAVVVAVDVAEPAQVEAVFDAAEERSGAVHAVFHAAGISAIAPVAETDDALWQRVLATNLSGTFHVARRAARALSRAGGGSLVCVASELALVGQAGFGAYTATKGGVLALTRVLAVELAPAGVRVNALSPGSTDTPMLRAEFALAADPDAERAANTATIPLGRIADPEDVAAAALWLLSDESRYVTGSNLVVDGGRTSTFPA